MKHACLVLILLTACGDDPIAPDVTVEANVSAVGTKRFEVTDAARSRTLVVQAWFPTDATAGDAPIESLEASPQPHDRYAALLAAAPACPSRTLPVAVDAAPAAGDPRPLVIISHCHACTRLSNATTAIRLASHGFAVASIEHLGDTLWESLDGTEATIDSAELEIRAADGRAVLDAIAAGTTPLGTVDLEHVGVIGHSMGAVTAGRIAQLDSRISAAAALAAPMENPLVEGVMITALDMPLMFVVAGEDNSITEFGNQLLRKNFENAPAEATKIEIPDAGHWSVSDLAGIVLPGFAPGCGDAVRQTDGSAFTYIAPAAGRDIASSYATAFFEATLRGNAGAAAYLAQPVTERAGVAVTVDHHD